MSLAPFIGLTALIACAVGAVFIAGRRAGRSAAEVKAKDAEIRTLKDVNDAKARMLDAAANAPRDRDALAQRVRDGTF
ncbi:hypothetical protein C2U72_10650 [Prosthecomicrobium hirschii]|uniref:hypothetical protein n=1 Tax=Prosthecodimorpha hirschii TaxID=665126 RepID=UPI001129B897|nr:hypothetical protein [Prosthecomicrobium hirschii]TPQ50985.1 hypothetical protein C2U72_10650 [Prosthecomicrobium hirschii]